MQKGYPSPTLILPLPLGEGGNRRGWAFCPIPLKGIGQPSPAPLKDAGFPKPFSGSGLNF